MNAEDFREIKIWRERFLESLPKEDNIHKYR